MTFQLQIWHWPTQKVFTKMNLQIADNISLRCEKSIKMLKCIEQKKQAYACATPLRFE